MPKYFNPKKINITSSQSIPDLTLLFINEPQIEQSQLGNFNINMTQPAELKIEIVIRFIPEFDGEKTKLHKFLNCCDVMASTYTRPEDQQMLLNTIKSKLSSKAYDSVKYKTYNTWIELKKLLTDQFTDRKTANSINQTLSRVTQNFNEDVRTYANRIEKLYSELIEATVREQGQTTLTFAEQIYKDLALKRFIEGLVPSIRSIIKPTKFQTLEMAVEAALEEELLLKLKNHHINKPSFNQNKSSGLFCKRCKRTGHRAENCYSNISKDNLQRKIHLMCNYCKKTNHTIKYCKKRIFNENRKEKEKSDQRSNKETNQGNASGQGTSGNALAKNVK